MNTATTMSGDPPVPVRAPRLLGLYLLLIIIAAIEAFDGLSHAPILFGDMHRRGRGAFQTPMQVIAFPLMGACAVALAARNHRLGLATLLVSIPTLSGVLAVIAFGISVFFYGF